MTGHLCSSLGNGYQRIYIITRAQNDVGEINNVSP